MEWLSGPRAELAAAYEAKKVWWDVVIAVEKKDEKEAMAKVLPVFF